MPRAPGLGIGSSSGIQSPSRALDALSHNPLLFHGHVILEMLVSVNFRAQTPSQRTGFFPGMRDESMMTGIGLLCYCQARVQSRRSLARSQAGLILATSHPWRPVCHIKNNQDWQYIHEIQILNPRYYFRHGWRAL
jgi:hypothetical protein